MDERVRMSRTVLDDAQAERSLTLAAFAVTVGDDDAVAQMMGLTEREVRAARRAVGKDSARARAEVLLAEACEAAEVSAGPDGTEGGAAGQVQVPVEEAAPVPQPAPGPVLGQEPQPQWSPAMDAVLVGAWQTQVDPAVVAAELGLDLQVLAARAHQLSLEGRLRPPAVGGAQPGRHRRGAETAAPSVQSSPVAGPASAEPGHVWHHWQWQRPAEPVWGDSTTTVAAHDWDGILNQWQAAQQVW
ncbi:hypothetical protein ACGFZL_19855 [Streptomyces sp. NPDC048182]|uniref:hypothetical protein n=1 Tax=Streptomyces sp. NPDC048182 TaxID=3365507 RepID=UPI0037130A95